MFHVGQLVVCVNGQSGVFARPGVKINRGLNGLLKGVVYTVREVRSPPDHIDASASLLLEEIQRPLWRGREPGYAAERFRPVDTTALDVFRTTSTPVTEDA